MTGIPYLDIIIFSAIIYIFSVYVVVTFVRMLRSQVKNWQNLELEYHNSISASLTNINHDAKNLEMSIAGLYSYIAEVDEKLSEYGKLNFLYEELLKMLQSKIGDGDNELDVRYVTKFKEWASIIWENQGTIEEHNQVVKVTESVRDRILLVENLIDILLKEQYKG